MTQNSDFFYVSLFISKIEYMPSDQVRKHICFTPNLFILRQKNNTIYGALSPLDLL